MASNIASLRGEILDMIFNDENDEEEFSGFSRAEAEEIERGFYEDDSGYEDLVAEEDLAPTEANVEEIQWSSEDSSEVGVPAFTEQVGAAYRNCARLFQTFIHGRPDFYNCG